MPLIRWINRIRQSKEPLLMHLRTVKGVLFQTEKIPLRYTKDYLPQYEIGEFTYGVPDVLYREAAQGETLKIGNFHSIAGGVRILLGGEHMHERVSTYPFPAQPKTWPGAADAGAVRSTKGSVVIGNDVWLSLIHI